MHSDQKYFAGGGGSSGWDGLLKGIGCAGRGTSRVTIGQVQEGLGARMSNSTLR